MVNRGVRDRRDTRISSVMAELTFHIPALDEERTVEGELVQENPIVVEESSLSRPNWRVEGNQVTLISEKAGIEITNFAEFREIQ